MSSHQINFICISRLQDLTQGSPSDPFIWTGDEPPELISVFCFPIVRLHKSHIELNKTTEVIKYRVLFLHYKYLPELFGRVTNIITQSKSTQNILNHCLMCVFILFDMYYLWSHFQICYSNIYVCRNSSYCRKNNGRRQYELYICHLWSKWYIWRTLSLYKTLHIHYTPIIQLPYPHNFVLICNWNIKVRFTQKKSNTVSFHMKFTSCWSLKFKTLESMYVLDDWL
jgi:hypothetical protein